MIRCIYLLLCVCVNSDNKWSLSFCFDWFCVHIIFWFLTDRMIERMVNQNWSISKRNRESNTCYVRNYTSEIEIERKRFCCCLHHIWLTRAFISHSPNFNQNFSERSTNEAKKISSLIVYLKWIDKIKLDFFVQFSFPFI